MSPRHPPEPFRNAADWISRHATVLTLLAIAALVLIPTGIAWRASESAGDASRDANRAIHRIQGERTNRIFEQNTANQYFCHRLETLENGLELLVGVSLHTQTAAELAQLTPAQRQARSVFSTVLGELRSAADCEVVIPSTEDHSGLLPPKGGSK